MSNPWAEHKQSEAILSIAGALERIADAMERYAAADPMTVLHEAMAADPRVGTDEMPQLLTEATGTTLPASKPEPQEPFASNGATIMYRHPDPRFEVVLRRDPAAESGYTVAIERA